MEVVNQADEAPLTARRITILVDGHVFQTLSIMAKGFDMTVEEYVVKHLIADGVG